MGRQSFKFSIQGVLSKENWFFNEAITSCLVRDTNEWNDFAVAVLSTVLITNFYWGDFSR